MNVDTVIKLSLHEWYAREKNISFKSARTFIKMIIAHEPDTFDRFIQPYLLYYKS